MIKKVPGHLPLERVDIWFQDEARFGQQNTTIRLWARKGTRPRAVRQQQFEYAYLFGAVCPSTGKTEALITPFVNKDIMREHLSLISKATDAGRYAIVIMDGAGWHQEKMEQEFVNLKLIKLPPYSPELNPIEQVWSWLRQHHLANKTFSNYEEIVNRCQDAWNDFVSDAHRVKNMCSRQWINMGNSFY